MALLRDVMVHNESVTHQWEPPQGSGRQCSCQNQTVINLSDESFNEDEQLGLPVWNWDESSDEDNIPVANAAEDQSDLLGLPEWHF